MSSESIKVFSKSGVELIPGLHLRVQHCVGRYGQIQTDEGVIESINHMGVTLALTKRSRMVFNGAVSILDVGQKRYIALRGEYKGDDRFICNYLHSDFEHGHSAWAEVVEADERKAA